MPPNSSGATMEPISRTLNVPIAPNAIPARNRATFPDAEMASSGLGGLPIPALLE